MKKKLAIALICVLLIGIVGGTLAYLTSQDAVTNTFTVGNVAITLDEAPVGENGKEIEGDRVDENSYKLLPGHEYDKDPTIHVAAGSEDCWLFVKVENGIKDIEATGDTTIAKQMEKNGWTLIDATNGIYAHNAKASADDDVVVFETFKIGGDGVTNEILAAYNGKSITVTAYAVQAAGFDTAADAWAAAKTELGA